MNSANVLQDAYQLIENGNLSEAQNMLDSIANANQNNPDYWWVRIHATNDPNEGQKAVDQLRKLDPNYPGLNDILSNQSDKPTSSVIRRFLGILLFSALLVLVLVFVLSQATTPNLTPTQIAENTPAVVPTEPILMPDDQPTPTSEIISASGQAVDGNNARLLELLSTFSIPQDPIEQNDNVLTIALCSTVGIEAGVAIRDVYVTLASEISLLSTTDSIRISIQDCFDTGATLRVVSIDKNSLARFSTGEITLQELQQAIQPVD